MRTRKLFLSIAISLALAIISNVTAWAQYGATLQGTVQDKSGAKVASAKVTVIDQATGVAKDTTTSAEGFYRLAEMAPGSYTVTVNATGFRDKVTKDVAVAAEAPRGLDITLEVGNASETVTVNGEIAPLLQTEDATVQGTLSSIDVENLPEIDRDPYELLRLAPGVFGDGARTGNGQSAGFPNGAGGNGGSAGPGGSNTAIFQVENQQPISANGQRVTSNDYLVDGVSVNSLQWGGAAVITPSIESVQEITVLSNDYDASDGRSSGAHIKTVTKSGTNALHGGGVFLYHDPNFNAYQSSSAVTTSGSGFTPPVRDDDALRQFAGTLGGPIIRNKLFFFFNYEGARGQQHDLRKQLGGNATIRRPASSGTGRALRWRRFCNRAVSPRALNNCCLPIAPSGFAATQPCAVVSGGIDIGSPYSTYGQLQSQLHGRRSGAIRWRRPRRQSRLAICADRSARNHHRQSVQHSRGLQRRARTCSPPIRSSPSTTHLPLTVRHKAGRVRTSAQRTSVPAASFPGSERFRRP